MHEGTLGLLKGPTKSQEHTCHHARDMCTLEEKGHCVHASGHVYAQETGKKGL